MKKLLELLNEYEKSGLNEFEIEKYEERWCCKWNGRIFRGNWENNNELTPYELCSKHYGFIKRLVDNDKIDNSKFYDKNILKGFMTLTKEEKADSIIMNLSIQDNPIEFLVSILK